MRKLFSIAVGMTVLTACSSIPGFQSVPSLSLSEIKETFGDSSYQCSLGLPFEFKEMNLDAFEKIQDFIKNGSKFACDWRRLNVNKKYDMAKIAFKCNAEDFKEKEKKEYGLYYDDKILIKVDKKSNLVRFLDQLAQEDNEINFCTDDQNKKKRQLELLKDMFGENTSREFEDFMGFYRHIIHSKSNIDFSEAKKRMEKLNECIQDFLIEIQQISQEENPINQQIKSEEALNRFRENLEKNKENTLNFVSVKGVLASIEDIKSDMENGTVTLKLDLDLDVLAGEANVYDGNYRRRTFKTSLTDANKKQLASLSRGQIVYVNGFFYSKDQETTAKSEECPRYMFPFCFRMTDLDFSAESKKSLEKRKAAEEKREKQRLVALEKKLSAKKCSFLKDDFDLKINPFKKKAIQDYSKTDRHLQIDQAMENFLGLLDVNAQRVGIDSISCFTSGDTTGYTIDGEGYYFKKINKKLVLQGTVQGGKKYPCNTPENRSCETVAEDMLFSSNPIFAAFKELLGG